MGKTMAPSGSPRQWWKKDAEGADAAPEEIVVTPHGHESDQYTEPEEEINTPK